MQVEENANNGSKISCQKKIGKPNQIFNFEKTNKTILPPSQTKKEEFHKPVLFVIFQDQIGISRISINFQLLML